MSAQLIEALKPCPFCGAGTTTVHPNGAMWTGQRKSDPVSVSIRHWCDAVPGQPSRMIERIGKDEASAVAAWNGRAALAAAEAQPVVPIIAARYRNSKEGAWSYTDKDIGGIEADGWREVVYLCDANAAPVSQPVAVPQVTDDMARAYLAANKAYWAEVDAAPSRPGVWRDGTPHEATLVGLRAALAAAPAAPAVQPLTDAELELCRQWFDALQDTNGGYLDRADYVLAARLYRVLGMRVPSSITGPAA